MNMICCDLESVFVPEIWIGVAKRTGIEELKITTRDEPDYDKLMKRRIQILQENNLGIKEIQEVIAQEEPLPGAKDFLDWLRTQAPVTFVSDTFLQFADPLMEKLGRPMLMCNELEIKDGKITKHIMRQDDQKRKVVKAMHSLKYKVIAFGDSYNDTKMLKEADHGILFNSPQNVRDDFPELPFAKDYDELKEMIIEQLK